MRPYPSQVFCPLPVCRNVRIHRSWAATAIKTLYKLLDFSGLCTYSKQVWSTFSIIQGKAIWSLQVRYLGWNGAWLKLHRRQISTIPRWKKSTTKTIWGRRTAEKPWKAFLTKFDSWTAHYFMFLFLWQQNVSGILNYVSSPFVHLWLAGDIR